MFGSIFRFELGYQLRGAAFIAIFAIFFLMSYGSIASDQLQIGSSEATNINSPFVAMQTISIMSVVGIFMPVVFMATGVTRDQSLRTDEVFRATPVGRRTVLLGRYFGGLLATFFCFAAVPLGLLFGSLMPWLDQEQMGPFNPGQVAYLYALFGALNLLVLGTILFTVANLTRSMIAVWAALVALFIGWVTGTALSSDLETQNLAALLEPFGLAAYFEQTQFWTAAERNADLPQLTGLLLQNRLLWGGVAALLLLINVALPNGVTGVSLARFRKRTDSAPAPAALRAVSLPRAEPAPVGKAWPQQFARRVRFEAFGIMRSVAFWIVLVLSVMNTLGSLLNLGNLYGTESYPITTLMIRAIEGAFAFVPLVIAVYYTAELIWRERGFKFNEITDAAPTPSWVFVLAKYIAVLVVLVLMAVVAAGTAIATQLFRGFTFLEIDQYVVRLAIDFVGFFALLTVLALFIQVLANNKWLGIGVFLAYVVVSVVMDNLGADHILYNYGGGIDLTYSDMNGYGMSLGISAWMLLYWGSAAVILSVLTFALWSRGSLDPMFLRLRQVPNRLRGASGGLLLASIAVMAATGSWVFYNTNVRNTYANAEALRDRSEAFERKWRKDEFAPQPKITSVDLKMDLFPKERRVVASVDYVLQNKTETTLDQMRVDYDYDVDVVSHRIEGASVSVADEEFNHFVFAFDDPMEPGETRLMTAEVTLTNPGFRNSGNNPPIRANGTFLNSSGLPRVGWGIDKILTDRAERRKRGLPIDPRLPKLDDERYWNVSLLAAASNADWVDFRAEITTSADQIAIAPGYLVSDTTTGDRRTFVYEQDVPIQNFYAVQSARYTVAEDVWEAPEGQDDVKLQIFYDEKHPYNVDLMMRAMKLSFDKFTDVFTPFQYRQMRIQEFPYSRFAQSFPNTVPYSENIGFILKLDDEDAEEIDAVTYVTAHELAHQWFGHQLSASAVQGTTMVIEAFAQYGALLVMADLYGEEHIRRFLRYELNSYLSGRASEPLEEMPLYLVENQGYIHYGKGSLVMWLLRDQVGEETVNRALRRMIETWGYKSDPYPRSVDFLAILREEAGPEHEQLIQDLFEKITLYDVDVKDAVVSPRDDGRFDLTVTVDAKKLYADGQGNETETPLDIALDFGVFSSHPRDVKDGTEHIIAFERRNVVSGEQTFTIIVDEQPSYAGIDPYNKLVDRRPENNIKEVDVKAAR
ncbi:MAG: M1 family aminopeptidase [Pseudomonadota bacterium]